ncbi:hypothetical protein B566_EDAN016416 [Ephemera danica]|nr:hypothetical protein B566_EDAN016416 [Ephemera danica]
MVEGGPQMQPFLVELPQEDRKLYPESVQVLESAAVPLADNNYCSSSLKAQFDKLQLETRSQLYERQELLHELNQTKLQTLPDILKELYLVPQLGTGSILTTEQDVALRTLVHGQLQKTATKLKPLVESSVQREMLENECKDLSEEHVRNLALAGQLVDQSDVLLHKVKAATHLENQRKEMDVKLIQLRCKHTALKTKLAEIEVMREMYGKEKGEAIRILLQDKTKELEDTKTLIEKLIKELDAYQRLPKSEFYPIVQQHQQVIRDIENAKWSLAKMQDKD